MASDRTPNEPLSDLVRESGLSGDSLSAAVRQVAMENGDFLRTNRSTVTHWTRYGEIPSLPVRRYIMEVLARRLRRALLPEDLGFPHTMTDDLGLDLGSDPVETIMRMGRADIDRRTFLTSATYSAAAAALPLATLSTYQARAAAVQNNSTAGRAEIEAVHDMTAMFTAIDERHGGQHGRTAVVQYLTTDVASLCRARWATAEQRRQMLSAAASVAYLAGWKAFDAGQVGLAQRYYLQSFALTQEAGDEQHSAFALRILAHHGMDARQPENTLALADRALGMVAGKTDPSTEAVFVVTRARALGMAGRKREAVAELARAGQMAWDGDEAEMQNWAALWGSARATVESHTAKTLRQIGDKAGAEKHYRASSAARTGGRVQQRRIIALSMADEASMQFAQGHVEMACDTWGNALGLLDGIRSDRVVKAVTSMRRDLHAQWVRGVRAAVELDQRAGDWLAIN